MGLDCYIQRSPTSPETLRFSEDIDLCGGMFSGNGHEGSFRGKVYADVFEKITRLSLYNELSVESVKSAAQKLQDWKQSSPCSWVSDQELVDLTKLFQEAAQQNCVCHAWY